MIKPLPPANPSPAHPPRPGLSRAPTAEERRRAQRVFLRIPVLIHITGEAQPVLGKTHTVSATGGLIMIPVPLAEGAKVVIENPKTQAKVEAKVIRPPQVTAEGSLIPLEFCTSSPTFWNISFPPAAS